eukprot:TRINITY_DN13854_c0_g1_i2.p1 TRINITY_DN13854_c0_g1~~TRINITY_DN13854_c0_g1_i2.p1  ORF type:complete len:518 (-),score=110.60 TRINITY_DN13854_c0_g1_i2:161-1573(-)
MGAASQTCNTCACAGSQVFCQPTDLSNGGGSSSCGGLLVSKSAPEIRKGERPPANLKDTPAADKPTSPFSSSAMPLPSSRASTRVTRKPSLDSGTQDASFLRQRSPQSSKGSKDSANPGHGSILGHASMSSSHRSGQGQLCEAEENDTDLQVKHLMGRNVRQWVPPCDRTQEPAAKIKRQLGEVVQELLEACRAGNFQHVIDAMKQGADVNCVSLRGQTPLMLACGSKSPGAVDCVRFLLEAEADIEVKDETGWTALLHAVRSSCQEQVSMLLDMQADVKVKSLDGRTPVMLAILEGHDDLCQLLVQSQAALDKKDDRGWSVLFFACNEGRVEIVKWLLKLACDPAKDRTKDGHTPLMVCMNANPHASRKIGKLLRGKGANLNARDDRGATALIQALEHYKEDFAAWLVEEGADVTIKTREGVDAIDLAEERGFNALKLKLDCRARIQAEAASEAYANEMQALVNATHQK